VLQVMASSVLGIAAIAFPLTGQSSHENVIESESMYSQKFNHARDRIIVIDSANISEPVSELEVSASIDEKPILIDAPEPVYPEGALKEGIGGDVWIKLLVDKDGSVRDVFVARESGKDVGFEEAAIRAAWQRKYRPAIKDGQPVAVWVAYKVIFGDENVVKTGTKADADTDCPEPDSFEIIDVDPILLSGPEPEFPDEAKKEGIEGTVWIRAYVDKHGTVKCAEIKKDSGTDIGFEEAALEAAIERKYKPAMLEGEPIGVWIAYKVVFELDE